MESQRIVSHQFDLCHCTISSGSQLDLFLSRSPALQVNDLEASEFDRKLGISRDTRQSSNGRTTAPQRTPVSVEEDRWGEL
eukprot:521905-Pelagomonas_calceolata.AAC.1